jgi:hypothetical protein
VLAGAIFAAFGVLALIVSSPYPVGTAVRMGPGYLPRIVAWGLVGLGALSILRGALAGGWRMPTLAPRPVLAIALAVFAFAATIDRLGLFVAGVIAVLIAGAGDPGLRWRHALAIALALAAFCSLLFGWALGLSLPVWPR